MKAVGSVLGAGKPKVDPAVAAAQAKQQKMLDDQEKAQAEEKKQLQTAQNAKLNASRSRRAGSRSLLTGLETGVRTELG